VAQIESIRYLREVERWSLRRIARELHVSPKTIAKCLDRTVPTEEPRYTRKRPASHPKMDVWRQEVDAWILADQDAPPKQRHTARRMWERLRDELGADVAESTVRSFVAGGSLVRRDKPTVSSG